MSLIINATNMFIKAQKLSRAWLYGIEESNQEALELFKKSAQLFAMSAKDDEAFEAYNGAIRCAMKLKEDREQIDLYQKMAVLYETREQYIDVITCRKSIIEIYNRCNSLLDHTYMKNLHKIATMYERLEEYTDACSYYEESIKIADTLGLTSVVIDDTVCLAQLTATKLKRYRTAVDIYLELIKKYSDDTALKFKVNGLIIDMLICALCSDPNNDASSTRNSDSGVTLCNTLLVSAPEINPLFESSHHENELMHSTLHAIEEGEITIFEEAVRTYDSYKRLSTFQVDTLTTVKKIYFETDVDSDEDIL